MKYTVFYHKLTYWYISYSKIFWVGTEFFIKIYLQKELVLRIAVILQTYTNIQSLINYFIWCYMVYEFVKHCIPKWHYEMSKRKLSIHAVEFSCLKAFETHTKKSVTSRYCHFSSRSNLSTIYDVAIDFNFFANTV